MHIAVLGCGAIGGIVAANLSRAGLRVTPITGNAAISAAIVERGYRVRELDGHEWSTPATAPPLVSASDATSDASGDERRRLDPFDVCILATQSTRMAAALESVRSRLGPGAPVVCLQNGLPEDRIAQLVGPERVVGCVVGWGASMKEPGLYVRTSRGGFTIGHPASLAAPIGASDESGPRPGPRGAGADLVAIARLLEPAGAVRVADDLAGVRWSKLAINCCSTTLGAVGGHPLGVLMRHRFCRRLALEVFAEVAAVAKAAGVRMAPVGGTLDIERVAITASERALRVGSPSLVLKHSLLLAVGFKFRRMRSSMLYALERGRPPEIDYLNVEVVARGEALGVPTPVNRALVAEVRALFDGQGQPGVETLRGVYQRAIGGGAAAAT